MPVTTTKWFAAFCLPGRFQMVSALSKTMTLRFSARSFGRRVSAEIRPAYYSSTGFHALLDFDELDEPVLHLV
jgi:hypothetical protein